METIFVKLLDEGVDAWRPILAERVAGDVYRIVDQELPAGEKLEFQPGTEVVCKPTMLSEGVEIVAMSRADTST